MTYWWQSREEENFELPWHLRSVVLEDGIYVDVSGVGSSRCALGFAIVSSGQVIEAFSFGSKAWQSGVAEKEAICKAQDLYPDMRIFSDVPALCKDAINYIHRRYNPAHSIARARMKRLRNIRRVDLTKITHE